MINNETINILITGVAGLIGARMADWIIENIPNSKVIGIDDLSGGYLENIHEKLIFFNRNLCIDNISDIFKEYKPTYVYHFAAYAAEGLSPFIRIFNYKNNVISTANVVNNCVNYNVKRIIFTSSMGVYGDGNPPFTENDNPRPIDPYGIAKFSCEQDIKSAGSQFDLDWCIIRPHNVFGVKQNLWDRYRNVLAIWMWQALNNLPLTIYGDGEQTRAFTFIDNTLEPLWKAATIPQTSKQIINLGGIKEYSINQMHKYFIEIIGERKTIYLEPRVEVRQAHCSFEKSIQLLDYREPISIKEGMKLMWEWAVKFIKYRPRLLRTYEIEKGLYSYWNVESKDEGSQEIVNFEKVLDSNATLSDIFLHVNNKNDNILITNILFGDVEIYNSIRPFKTEFNMKILEVINKNTFTRIESDSMMLKVQCKLNNEVFEVLFKIS